MAERPVGLGAIVRGTAKVSAELGVATELWYSWAHIALAQAKSAREGRESCAAAKRTGGNPDWNAELHPAMVAIAAAATSLDGFATLAQEAGAIPAVPTEATRAYYVWEILRAGFDVGHKTNTWPRDLKDLFILRSDRMAGGLLHPKTVFGEPAQHPEIGSVSQARSLYTMENADNAVALMRDLYGTCRVSVRQELGALKQRIDGLSGLFAEIS
jgi:hypothetical protein